MFFEIYFDTCQLSENGMRHLFSLQKKKQMTCQRCHDRNNKDRHILCSLSKMYNLDNY